PPRGCRRARVDDRRPRGDGTPGGPGSGRRHVRRSLGAGRRAGPAGCGLARPATSVTVAGQGRKGRAVAPGVLRGAAGSATPNTRLTITEHHGTRAWYTAARARPPWRMVEARSAATPITKPGWSTRCTTGRWKVSARSTRRVTFWEASAVHPAP